MKASQPFPPQLDAEHRLDRRRFLGAAGCAALLAVAGEWAARRASAAPAAPPDVALAATAVPPAGGSASVATGAREALVVKLADGGVVAYDRRCPHLGCPVLWAPQRERFECPCHRAAFDARTGAVLFGPPRTGLTPARLRITTAQSASAAALVAAADAREGAIE